MTLADIWNAIVTFHLSRLFNWIPRLFDWIPLEWWEWLGTVLPWVVLVAVAGYFIVLIVWFLADLAVGLWRVGRAIFEDPDGRGPLARFAGQEVFRVILGTYEVETSTSTVRTFTVSWDGTQATN